MGPTIARAEKYSRSSQATNLSYWLSAACKIAQAFSSFSVSSAVTQLKGSGLLCETAHLRLARAFTLCLAGSAASHRTTQMVCSPFHHPVLRLLNLTHELLHHHVLLRTHSRYLRSLFSFTLFTECLSRFPRSLFILFTLSRLLRSHFTLLRLPRSLF